MITWGLCCLFRREPIKFRRATAAGLAGYGRREQLHRLAELVRFNLENLVLALATCRRLDIGAFRINSELLPLATHPAVGYQLDELPGAERIRQRFAEVRNYAAAHALRLSFHPDQFVVLNSPNCAVVQNSLRELQHQALLAGLCGAAEINLHAGGVYGDKRSALQRWRNAIAGLPSAVVQRLTLENDDRCYTPADLLPVCRELQIPLVYDVHHHRVNPDHLSIEEATRAAARTWASRHATPHFHLSSPAIPWQEPGDHRSHAETIDPADFPAGWRHLDLTVDVEAKAKELAIRKLRGELAAGTADSR